MVGFGRSPHCEEERDQDKRLEQGGLLRQVQQAEAGGGKHRSGARSNVTRSLAVTNSSKSLAISHWNRSMPIGKQKLVAEAQYQFLE